MKSNEYQELAARTLIDAPKQPLSPEELFMAVTLLRMHSSLGRLTEVFKKNVLHRHRGDEDRYKLEEFGLDMKMLGSELKSLSELDQWGSFSKDYAIDKQNTMVLWNVIGLLGESSELAQLLLACELNALHGVIKEWEKELGDVAWYHAAIATKLGVPLGSIQEANIDKLKKRFPSGFTTEDSIKRVDVTQVAPKSISSILEQVQQDLSGKMQIGGLDEVVE